MLNLLVFILTGFLINSCGQNDTKTLSQTAIEPVVDNKTESVPKVVKLDSTTYEILVTDHQPAVENFHVLLKSGDFDKQSLQDFVDKFRQELCNQKCNISIYDDKGIKSLVTKHPLEGREYLKVADHFVASSTFDMTDVWLYPFQDIRYKELGGKNWKREVIR